VENRGAATLSRHAEIVRVQLAVAAKPKIRVVEVTSAQRGLISMKNEWVSKIEFQSVENLFHTSRRKLKNTSKNTTTTFQQYDDLAFPTFFGEVSVVPPCLLLNGWVVENMQTNPPPCESKGDEFISVQLLDSNEDGDEIASTVLLDDLELFQNDADQSRYPSQKKWKETSGDASGGGSRTDFHCCCYFTIYFSIFIIIIIIQQETS
jgi:hypothetical protein